MPILLFQKPAKKSKAKNHTKCLQRRLNAWRDGHLNELLREGRTIQQHIPRNTPPMTKDKLSRQFANHMFQGKTKAALRLRLLSEQNRGGVLHLDDPIDTENGTRKVRDILIDKHPPSQPVNHDSIINADPPDLHPVLFESLDASIIKSAALHISGAAGPSGLDALSWRRLCTSFKAASQELCHSLALTAQRLCTDLVDPAIYCTPLVLPPHRTRQKPRGSPNRNWGHSKAHNCKSHSVCHQTGPTGSSRLNAIVRWSSSWH